MTKGFKDSKGKFHPTENTSKLSSRDVMQVFEEPSMIDAKILKIKKESMTKVDPLYGLFIANGYEDLKHEPNNPQVKKAYDIFINETLEQARELQKNGMQFDPKGSVLFCASHGISCGKDGNYEDADEMIKDVEMNNHIFYRKSDNDYKGVEDHPMFKITNFKNIDGEPMRANDVFRAVHDINGHTKSRSVFTPEGEQQSFLEHKKMYSPDAIRALFTETQGQGNWVNFNRKSGERNRHFQDVGDLEKLKFPRQKAGLFPDGIIFCP